MAGDSRKSKVILVGVGGATCSGKTTLAKHLRSILPKSAIIHQDDFAPPQELIPIHPVHNVQDWDAPRGAIEWPRLAAFLEYTKTSAGDFPAQHYSHDHLNKQIEVPIPDATAERWRKVFSDIDAAHLARGVKVIWRIVDGFLLYWNKAVVDALDVRIFLRVPEPVLRKRRHERHGYHTAVQSDPEGSLWRDPPHYWEQIVWPAYVEAHTGIFENNDLETGAAKRSALDDQNRADGGPVPNLILVDGLSQSMEDTVVQCCEILKTAIDTDNM